MTENTQSTGQEVEKKGILNFLKRLSLRNKVIGVALLVFLVLLVISIPGDRNELLARQAMHYPQIMGREERVLR
jgi:hypothetical protein